MFILFSAVFLSQKIDKSNIIQQISTDLRPGNKKQQPQLPPSLCLGFLVTGRRWSHRSVPLSHHDGLRKAWGPWHPTASSGTHEIKNRQWTQSVNIGTWSQKKRMTPWQKNLREHLWPAVVPVAVQSAKWLSWWKPGALVPSSGGFRSDIHVHPVHVK